MLWEAIQEMSTFVNPPPIQTFPVRRSQRTQTLSKHSADTTRDQFIA